MNSSNIRQILPIYAKLFHIIISTGIVPEDWAISIIKPIL